jgi:hypothetical protein
LVVGSRLVDSNCPENGVLGNYDPIQSELAEKRCQFNRHLHRLGPEGRTNFFDQEEVRLILAMAQFAST